MLIVFADSVRHLSTDSGTDTFVHFYERSRDSHRLKDPLVCPHVDSMAMDSSRAGDHHQLSNLHC